MSIRRISELVLDVTNKCPMKCLHCSAESGPHLGTFIPVTKAAEIIEQAALMGLETLSLSGGEPLAHPQLPEMIRLAHSSGVKDIRIFTSGIGSGNSRAVPIEDAYVQSLADAGAGSVFFNLQGGCTKTHEIITGTANAFEAVLAGSNICKAHDMYVGFHFVPMKPNWQELARVFSIARDLDIDEIGILRFVPQGRGLSNRHVLEMNTRDLQTFLGMASALMKQYDRPRLRLGCPFNCISEFVPAWKKKACSAASEMCHVLADGSVAPCSAFKHDTGMKPGNVYSQAFQDVWRAGFPNFTAERSRLSAEYECTAQYLKTIKVMQVAGVTRNVRGT